MNVNRPRALERADLGGDRPTMNAVVKYAEELRAAAERRMSADPYARPYYPTTAGATMIARRIANELEARTREANPDTPEPVLEALVEEARAEAPARAIARLRERAALVDHNDREQRERSERAAARHARRQTRAGTELASRRRSQSWGERLDAVLRDLGTISAAPTQRIDGDRVQGGDNEHAGPAFNGDPAGGARREAQRLVESLEQRLDDARGANRLHGPEGDAA